MSEGRKYAPPLGRGASLEAAGAVRSMCHALRIHPLETCPIARIVTIPPRRVMAQCTENVAASCSVRHPLLPMLRGRRDTRGPRFDGTWHDPGW